VKFKISIRFKAPTFIVPLCYLKRSFQVITDEMSVMNSTKSPAFHSSAVLNDLSFLSVFIEFCEISV